MTPRIDRAHTDALSERTGDELRALCAEAYDEDVSQYFSDIGPGVHLLGWLGDQLVSHAMWVTRTLYLDGGIPLRAAYVELVATPVKLQRRGFASQLLKRLEQEIQDYDLGALSPSDPMFYGSLGWEMWRGPLLVRTADGVEATPDEAVMVLRLPATPERLDLNGSLTVDGRPGEVW